MTSIQERFATNLRKHRARHGISQEELAFRAAIHRTQVSFMEAGDRLPRFETSVKLAGSLGITLNDLAEGIVWEPVLTVTGGMVIAEAPEGGG